MLCARRAAAFEFLTTGRSKARKLKVDRMHNTYGFSEPQESVYAIA